MTTKTSRATFRSSLRAFVLCRIVAYPRPSPPPPPCHLDLSLKSSSLALSRFLLPLIPVRVARDEHHLQDALYFDRAMAFYAVSNDKKCEGTSPRESLSITDIKMSRFMYKEGRVLYDGDVYDGASFPRPFRWIFDLHQIHIRLTRAIRRQAGEFFTGSPNGRLPIGLCQVYTRRAIKIRRSKTCETCNPTRPHWRMHIYSIDHTS